VLGEKEDTEVGTLGLEQARGGRAFVVVGRWHPDVEHDEVGRGLRDQLGQTVGRFEGGDDGVALVREQPRQPVAQQRLVLGNDHPHGRVALRLVPALLGYGLMRVRSDR
jgi:hypothetical protein